MKYVKVTMSDHTEWLIPADVIAKDRATYFAKKFECITDSDEASHRITICEGSFPEIYVREYDIGMSDDHTLTSWASVNMDWMDVAQFARRISGGNTVDYVEDWVNADKQIVEMEE